MQHKEHYSLHNKFIEALIFLYISNLFFSCWRLYSSWNITLQVLKWQVLMKVKLISCKTPTAEHYKVSVVQTAQLIIQMWRISEGDLLSFTADFQGIIHNRAVIRKLWQTQRTGTSAYLPGGFVQDLIIRVRTFLRIKGKLHIAKDKQSNQLHGFLSHKPREDSRLMHINCLLQKTQKWLAFLWCQGLLAQIFLLKIIIMPCPQLKM